MGLDVQLYQFKDVDTDTILELSRLAEEPYSDKEIQKWKALPLLERGDTFPSQKRKTEGYQKLVARARELGFPESRFAQPGFGGTQISFPSTHHADWPIGDWYSFGHIRALLRQFFGKDLYFIFPEAKGIHGLIRPDWQETKNRLVEIVQELKAISPQTWKEVYPFDTGDRGLKQLEVMIETLDFVLNSGNPREFLLYWSE